MTAAAGMRLGLVLALAALLGTLAGAAEPEATVPGAGTPGDDDQRISESEILAPSMDSRDPAWTPAYEWHEDPASLDCGGRPACQDYKGNETRGAERK